MYMYHWITLLTLEINTALLINYALILKKKL